MSDNNTTMRSILASHRAEMNDLDQELANTRDELESSAFVIDRLRNEKSDIEARHNHALRITKDLNDKVAKLEGVIDSLKIELANERAAHTATREGGVPHSFGRIEDEGNQ